ncbi:unnamed protein product, partial [marine sediment metagenome]
MRDWWWNEDGHSSTEPVSVRSTGGDWNVGSWYTMTVSAVGDTITAYLRNKGDPFSSAELIGQLYDHTSQYSSGGLGFITNGCEAHIDNVVIYDDAASYDSETITAISVPFDQEHETDNQIKFAISDNAGNIGTSNAYTVKIDATEPTIEITSVTSSQGTDNWYEETANELYYFSDDDGIAHVVTLTGDISDGGSGPQKVSFSSCFDETPQDDTNVGGGTWTSDQATDYEIAAGGGDPGGTVTVTAHDNAGLTNTDTVTFNEDNA